jgi:hypothetical protein
LRSRRSHVIFILATTEVHKVLPPSFPHASALIFAALKAGIAARLLEWQNGRISHSAQAGRAHRRLSTGGCATRSRCSTCAPPRARLLMRKACSGPRALRARPRCSRWLAHPRWGFSGALSLLGTVFAEHAAAAPVRADDRPTGAR